MHTLQRYIYSTCYLQITAICLTTLLWLLFFGENSGLAFFSGGLAWFFPCLYFAIKTSRAIFPPRPNQNAFTLLKSFYRSEVKKLGFSAVLVILFAHYLPQHIGALLVGYIIAVMTVWFWPLLHKVNRMNR